MYEIPSEKPRLRSGVPIAVVTLVCLAGFPLAYSAGFFGGKTEGFNEGWDAGRFDFYYAKPAQKYGVDELANWLSKWEWIKPYQANVFDCSEMSAYTERKLENEGWHTKIVVGNSPFSTGRHCWLLVETRVGKYMPVESIDLSVVMLGNPNFDKYFEYDHQFETIQEALEHSESEFDWWN
jgi:hypothetical protein